MTVDYPPQAGDFEIADAFSMRPENDGQGYHVDPNDPGGATNMAVVQATWDDAVRAGMVEGTLRDASLSDLKTIRCSYYWQANHCSYLPPGVDLIVYDMGLVSGANRAARLFQTALGVVADGIIGPVTIAAAHSVSDLPAFIQLLTSDDERFFGELRDFSYFGRGWDARAAAACALALTLVPPALVNNTEDAS